MWLAWFDLGLVVRRHELTDEQWQVIEPLLPVSGARGRPRVDDRRVINGMLFKAKTGVAWRNLPGRIGQPRSERLTPQAASVAPRARLLPHTIGATSRERGRTFDVPVDEIGSKG